MEIVEKEILAQVQGIRIIKLRITAPVLAAKVRPGQFVVLMVNAQGERIPLTVVDNDKESIVLIFQEAGLTTKLLGRLDNGDTLYVLVGPLGHPTEIKNYGRVILVGGGVGIAEIYPVAKALKEAGNHITTVLGARTKELLILENELRGLSNEFYAATDDGSYGRKGFTTDILKELLTVDFQLPTPNLIYAVGPIPMMKKVTAVTKEFNIKALVSLNALMVDATGMCGVCRVSVAGQTKFTCIDGPDFDAHLVDWDELSKRNKVYEEKEKHICNLYKV